jgi:hypothetical protein
MISTATFKKQIAKTLSENLRKLGFKGAGFDYIMDSENFIFTIGIQPNRYGSDCFAELGIQPKNITTNDFENLDFTKLKYYNCELRTRIEPDENNSNSWKYFDNEDENITVAKDLIRHIEKHVISIINQFKLKEDVFSEIEITDLEDFYKLIPNKLFGMKLMTTDIRFAWILTKHYENKNLIRAKEFAKFGITNIKENSTFIGKTDFDKVINKLEDKK